MSGPANNLVALTGATGFIGRHLLADLTARGYRIRVLLRRPGSLPEGAASAVVGDLTRPINMAAALAGVDAVVHSAGLAHAMSGTPEDDYRTLNTQATRRLAEAAARAGVRRFVFLSSIRAQVGASAAGTVTEADPAQPTDAYGRSKLEAEAALAETSLDWVALRPVLVYGAGVKGNMAALFRLARSPYPLPLGGFTARRSLISLDSLSGAVDAVLRAQDPIRAAWIATDPDPLSLPEILSALRAGLDRRPRLAPVPAPLVGLACRLTGREELFARAMGALIARADGLAAVGWRPAVPTREGLERFARAGG